jgi:hypothetical protein
VRSASEIAESGEIDCAVLDVRIGRDSSNGVADALAHRGIPFLYSTGSAVEALEKRHRSRPLLTKPFSDDEFKRVLLDTWRAPIEAAGTA